MENRKNINLTKRDAIRNKLKGSLNSFKLAPESNQTRGIMIGDRTPEPGIVSDHFDDMYELGKKIGEGASGSVYLCKSKANGKTYAVNISRGDVELLRISKRAFKIMKRLNHPNIIKAKCLYLNQKSEKTHFIMEHCSYPSLSKIEFKLTYQQKKQIVKQLLLTLNYLHSQGICHRDIKLDNVLYNEEDGKIKLIDFGISKKIFNRKNQFMEMWTTTGTLHYMAPEMFLGGAYNQKVDIWAMGVMIYKLFYGVFPFECQYKSQMIQKITSQQPQYAQQNIILNDLIKHILVKDPKNRLTAAQCLKHPWIENELLKTKQRLNSGQNLQLMLEIRMRNYSVNMAQSPVVRPSREDQISDLKQSNIFQLRRQYFLAVKQN